MVSSLCGTPSIASVYVSTPRSRQALRQCLSAETATIWPQPHHIATKREKKSKRAVKSCFIFSHAPESIFIKTVDDAEMKPKIIVQIFNKNVAFIIHQRPFLVRNFLMRNRWAPLTRICIKSCLTSIVTFFGSTSARSSFKTYILRKVGCNKKYIYVSIDAANYGKNTVSIMADVSIDGQILAKLRPFHEISNF